MPSPAFSANRKPRNEDGQHHDRSVRSFHRWRIERFSQNLDTSRIGHVIIQQDLNRTECRHRESIDWMTSVRVPRRHREEKPVWRFNNCKISRQDAPVSVAFVKSDEHEHSRFPVPIVGEQLRVRGRCELDEMSKAARGDGLRTFGGPLRLAGRQHRLRNGTSCPRRVHSRPTRVRPSSEINLGRNSQPQPGASKRERRSSTHAPERTAQRLENSFFCFSFGEIPIPVSRNGEYATPSHHRRGSRIHSTGTTSQSLLVNLEIALPTKFDDDLSQPEALGRPNQFIGQRTDRSPAGQFQSFLVGL